MSDQGDRKTKGKPVRQDGIVEKKPGAAVRERLFEIARRARMMGVAPKVTRKP